MSATYPFVDVGDRYLVTFAGSLIGQRILNTFWYRVEELINPTTYIANANALESAITAAAGLKDKFLDAVPENYSLDEIWIQQIYPQRWFKLAYAVGEPGFRPQTATANTAAVIERRGALGNRHNVGSLHVPLSTDTACMDAGILTALQTTKLNAIAAVMVNPYNLTNVTWRPVLNNGAGTADWTALINCFAQDTARVMRRRTVRVGI